MKILNLMKKNMLAAVIGLVYMLLFLAAPEKALLSLNNSAYYLKEMLVILPVIFLFTAVIEALVPKELILRSFGEHSGIKGNMLALLLGSISAGPIYAAFPIGKMLLQKGASVANVVVILSSWAVIKIPMLANEVKFLGAEFMGVRWVLTVFAIFAMAQITDRLVKKEDLPLESQDPDIQLTIRESYCIGCGLCVRMLPDFYKMDGNRAVVIDRPLDENARVAVRITAEKCPSKAIMLHLKEEKIS